MGNRKTARSTPKIAGGFLTYWEETGLGRFYHTVSLDSADFYFWLKRGQTFSYEGRYTVRREKRANGYFWYAFKRDEANAGRLEKHYIGKDEAVTAEKLMHIGWAFQYGKDSPLYKRIINS